MREEIYHKQLKPFFQDPMANHIQFARKTFKEDVRLLKMDLNKDDDGQLKKKNCCEQYFIIDPQKKNSLLPLWKLVFMAAIITEMALVPYTACLGIEQIYMPNENLEMIIDVIWISNICITFCTAALRDGQLEKDFKKIAKRYVSGLFVFDIISCLPAVLMKVAIQNPDWDPSIRTYMMQSYLLKLLRIAQVGNLNKIMLEMVTLLETKLGVSKQTVNKLRYFTAFTISLLLTMHSIACFWVKIGTENENTWIDERNLDKSDTDLLYITAIYWVTATLTTVGYGDVKSQITYEYVYTMFTEFVGIGFFSFIMGSINTVLLTDVGESDEIAEKIEQVDIWLVALDNAKKEKSLPNVLYNSIKVYIKN